jgi:TolA-binding protein
MRSPTAPPTTCVLLLGLAIGWGGLAAERPEAPADLQFDFAEGLFRDGIYKLAIQELEKFLKSFPKDPRASKAWLCLGECHYINKDYKAALPAFEAAARDEKLADRPLALYRAGDCLFRLDRIADSVGPLRQFLATKELDPRKHRPFVVHARYTLARAEFSQRRFAEALPLFEQVLVDPAPENTYRGHVLLPIGDCLLALGKPADALARYQEYEKYLDAAIKAKPGGPDEKALSERLACVRTKIGGLLLSQNKHAEALAILGLVDAAGSFGEEVLFGRAQALFFLQRYQEALVPSQEYLKRFPAGQFLLDVLFIAGESSLHGSRFAEAEQHFTTFLAADKEKKHPARQAAAFGRAASAYRQGKERAQATAEASDFFLKEFHQSPRCPEAVYFRAEAAFWLAQYPVALEHYRRLPANSPYAEPTAHQIAVCLDLLKQHQEAAAAYDGYTERYTNGEHYKNALERSARLWGQLKQYAKAAERYGEFYKRYAAADRDLAQEFLYRKGACEYETKQYDAMFATFKEYFERFKDGAHKGDVHYFLAWYYSEQKQQFEAALDLYKLGADMPGLYQKLCRYQLARTSYRLAMLHLAEKRKKEADELFLKAAETFLYLMRASPEELAGPNDYVWTAELFREAGHKAEAIEAFEALHKRYPNEAKPTTIYWIGRLALDLEKPDYDKAKRQFKEFIERFRNHEYVIWAKYGLAEALKGAGDHAGAWEWYQQVELLAPHVIENAQVRDDLVLKCQLQMGRMAFEDKNWEFALKYLLRPGLLWTEEDPAAEALYKAGVAAHQLKNLEAAFGSWQRLIRIFPKSPWTQRLLKELDQYALRLAPDGKALEKKP